MIRKIAKIFALAKKKILAETLSGSHKIVEEKENGRTQDMI